MCQCAYGCPQHYFSGGGLTPAATPLPHLTRHDASFFFCISSWPSGPVTSSSSCSLTVIQLTSDRMKNNCMSGAELQRNTEMNTDMGPVLRKRQLWFERENVHMLQKVTDPVVLWSQTSGSTRCQERVEMFDNCCLSEWHQICLDPSEDRQTHLPP